MTLRRMIDPGLLELLAAHGVEVGQPRPTMLELKAVPAGPDFSKPKTNVLLRQGDGWDVFVDDDFAYVGGDDSRGPQFGDRWNRWRVLALPRPIRGNVNDAILCALGILDSPLCRLARHKPGSGVHKDDGPETGASGEPRQPAGGWTAPDEPASYGRPLGVQEFQQQTVHPTTGQAAGVNLAVDALMRAAPGVCPVLCGPAGVGKSSVARLAAGELLRRGDVKNVFEVSGAALCAGCGLPAERDRRLRDALQSAQETQAALVILEQFDRPLIRSNTATGLLAHFLDCGLKLIGVGQPQFGPDRVHPESALRRRLQFIPLKEAAPAETLRVLEHRLGRFQPSRRIEIARESLSSVLALSACWPGVNPGAALGLLEAVLVHADRTRLPFIGPDEVYHVHSLNGF